MSEVGFLIALVIFKTSHGANQSLWLSLLRVSESWGGIGVVRYGVWMVVD